MINSLVSIPSVSTMQIHEMNKHICIHIIKFILKDMSWIPVQYEHPPEVFYLCKSNAFVAFPDEILLLNCLDFMFGWCVYLCFVIMACGEKESACIFLPERVHCGSQNGTFLCHNLLCIMEAWVCDGTNDCGDNSDEEACPREQLFTALGCLTSVSSSHDVRYER